MNLKYLLALALACASSASSAQVQISATVKLGDAPTFTQSSTYQRYITRGNYCNVIVDNLVFTETIPGKVMLDLSMSFRDGDGREERNLRVIFDQLIQVSEPGKVIALEKSGQWLAVKIPLAKTSTIEVNVKAIPIVDTKYDPAYALLKPLIGQAITALPTNVNLGDVFDTFSKISNSSDGKNILVYSATIPVPQNVVEAQLIEKQQSRAPLRNNEVIAISAAGAREISDSNVLAKARDFLNGISSFIAGKNLINRPTSSITGMISLRFTKDFTQPLPESLLDELQELSNAADQAYTSDALLGVGTKATDAIKAIDAISKSKDIDSRADFHLRSYVDMARIWASYRKAVADGGNAVATTQWRALFKNWYQKQNIQGPNNYTQAYGITDLYAQNKTAKIFVPYSVSDEMILETLQRQTSLHQALADLSDFAVAEK